jgi:hypothetical protein
MGGSIMGPLGAGLEAAIRTFTQIKGMNAERKRQAMLDAQNAETHDANMQAAKLQQMLAQSQVDLAPQREAEHQTDRARTSLKSVMDLQGDAAYANPEVVEMARAAKMPFKIGQPPLQSRNMGASPQGITAGPMPSEPEMSIRAGLAPGTNVQLPEDVAKRARKPLDTQKILDNPSVPDHIKNFLRVRDIDEKGAIPAELFRDRNAEMDQAQENKKELVQLAATLKPPANPRDRFNAVQGTDKEGKPAIIRTNLDSGEVDVLPFPDGAGSKPPAQTAAQTRLAKKVIGHLDSVETMAREIEKIGLMGPIGGRWSDFMAGKIGTADLGNLSKDQQQMLSKFRTNVGLLKSGMAMVHGGARGGGSPEMAKRMDLLINSNKMDLPLFLGATDSFREWLDGYAQTADGPTAPAASSQSPVARKINIKAPDGSIHSFDTQAQADAFKTLAGIK